MSDGGRTVRAIVSVAGGVLGAVPPFAVESPWWADVEPVTAHLDAVLGVRTAVLRLARVVGGECPRGGEVTYHVEVDSPVAYQFEPVDEILGAHPLRAPYARPGGVRAVLRWADAALEAIGRPRSGTPTQVKTWNLSCVLRIPTAAGPVWCKSTRSFESSEPAAIAAVAAHDPAFVPAVLAARPGDALFDHIPGEDHWDADVDTVRAGVRRWAAVQAALAGAVPRGLPDLGPATLGERVARVLAVVQLSPGELAAARELAARLPALTAALAGTGLPTTLVHGDFHTGNWRGEGTALALVDWSDAHAGHPAEDLLRLASALPGPLAAIAAQTWCEEWTARFPGSDPAAALVLMRPLVHLGAAATYQTFLENIEPDEWPYHVDDPAAQVRLALAAAGVMA